MTHSPRCTMSASMTEPIFFLFFLYMPLCENVLRAAGGMFTAPPLK
jgi:hypothetical protein